MNNPNLPQILIISSYPPRECGIGTYSQDLIKTLTSTFSQSFSISVCALESTIEKHQYYPDEVKYILNTSEDTSFYNLAKAINHNSRIKAVLIEHEFGFYHHHEDALLHLVCELNIPVLITFHTVLPNPGTEMKLNIQRLVACCEGITVMTQNASAVLQKDYGIPSQKITVIAHGTHLVEHIDKSDLKQKYNLSGRTILSTFGLISSGKSIETTLEALPGIIRKHPDVLFLVIGKTHPTVLKQEGEKYRNMLEEKVIELNLQKHVSFVNYYLPLTHLLEYLQLTDIYLFTSKDPNQAVSGTFSYAISCGCPIVSTPIPHAKEVLRNDAGILIDFENAGQLSSAVILLLNDEPLRKEISINGLQRIASTAWENVAVEHAVLFDSLLNRAEPLRHNLPRFHLSHIRNLTSDFGMIQFSKFNHPDIDSGYTIDDNARAIIALSMHFKATGETDDLIYIERYLMLIEYCIQPDGQFLNYINEEKQFTTQNQEVNLDDANGRTLWALGYLIQYQQIMPIRLITLAKSLFTKALGRFEQIHSTRAIAFALKGLYYYNQAFPSPQNLLLAEMLGNRLERMYSHENEEGWNWYESYLTYGNSVLPEGMLCAYLITHNETYKSIAKSSFDFLLANTFTETGIKLISNKSWRFKGEHSAEFGEQPIDVAYTISALDLFQRVFEDDNYGDKIPIAFSWFLGNNHLHQIIYNPCTGGCYDGLEETHVNLNQGAESTVSYLISRCFMQRYENNLYRPRQESQQHESGILCNQ